MSEEGLSKRLCEKLLYISLILYISVRGCSSAGRTTNLNLMKKFKKNLKSS